MCRWIWPIVPEWPATNYTRPMLHFRQSGADNRNLRQVPYDRDRSSEIVKDERKSVRLALINVRSLKKQIIHYKRVYSSPESGFYLYYGDLAEHWN